MLDGAAKIDALFTEAQRLGQPALAMTDHGNLFGAAEFYRTSQRYPDVKPIIGIEAYLSPVHRSLREPVLWGPEGSTDDVGGKGAHTHITLLAENATGLRNLFILSSLASSEGFYRKPRCLLPGQEIMTRLGMKRIEDIEIGDEVLTHQGRFRPAVNVMTNSYSGEICGVRLNGGYTRTTWMTPEHPVLIRQKDGTKHWRRATDIVGGRPSNTENVRNWNSWACLPRVSSDTSPVSSIRSADHVDWTPVIDIPGKFTRGSVRRGMGPTNHYGTLPEFIDLDYDFGFFLGLYISEGHISRGQEVTFSFHQDERDLTSFCCKFSELLTGKSATIDTRPDRGLEYKGINVRVYSTLLSQLLNSLCGSGLCCTLHMPEFTFEAPGSFMEGIFRGVLAGDGSKTRPETVGLTQTSEQLHWQMRTLAARLNADFANTYLVDRRSMNHHQAYLTYFSPERELSFRHTLSDDDYVYKPIRDVLSRTYSGIVYNIEVEEDNSYVTDFAVHNCDRELLTQYHEGIIATTGCPGGEVSVRLALGQYREALQAASDFRDIFGKDNYFLELMDHGCEIERRAREELRWIGTALGLRSLATNDSHYVTADQATIHDALLCVQTRAQLSDVDRFRFEGSGYHLKSAEEMRRGPFSKVACDNTLAVAERVQSYAEIFEPRNLMPRVELVSGWTEGDMLRHDVSVCVDLRFPDGLPGGYQQRIDYELDMIEQMGFPGYFLVVADLCNWARAQGIAMGPGRGSAAGSLVCYLLGITGIDPIVHHLYFERFLNPERVSPPDIDLDFDERRRGEVVAYLSRRWGAENVAQVITFGTIKTRAALKDAARVLHGSAGYEMAEYIIDELPPAIHAEDVSLAALDDPDHPRYAETASIRQLLWDIPELGEVAALATGLEGLVRSAGVHACGIILSKEPLLGTVPLWTRQSDGAVITGWDYESCEALGLQKLDVLGSRTVSVIDMTGVDLSSVPLDDPATYDLLASGDTAGVFQLESPGMQQLLRRIKPAQFSDISVAVALYRPGPMGQGAHLEYADRKNKGAYDGLHPELIEPLADVLDETYGLFVYQEQIMAAARKVAGYSLGRADILRKAMGKKKREVLDSERGEFTDGMLDNGYSGAAIATLWDTMLPFASYAFVRAHSVSYAMIAYQCAYLKAHHPAEFMAAQLSSVSTDPIRRGVYLAECVRMGIKVLGPDVNESGCGFTVTTRG
jgi:DNA-directed DNA polymerase III PolC